jgi:hypothetical protein
LDLENQGFDALREVEFEAGEAIDQQAVSGLDLETAAVLLDQLHALAHMDQVEEMVVRVASRGSIAPDPLLADRNEIRLDRAEGVFLDGSEKPTFLGTLNVHLQKILANHIAPIRKRLAGLQVFGRPTLLEHCHTASPACHHPNPGLNLVLQRPVIGIASYHAERRRFTSDQTPRLAPTPYSILALRVA